MSFDGRRLALSRCLTPAEVDERIRDERQRAAGRVEAGAGPIGCAVTAALALTAPASLS